MATELEMTGRSRTQAMTVAAGLVLAAALAMAQGPLTSVEQGELDTLVRQLADPGRSPQTKVEAAELLLTRT